MEKARKVIAALEARPALFFQILRILHDEYRPASPWTDDEAGLIRLTPGGEMVADVRPEVSGQPPGQYTWWTETEDVGVEGSEEAAQQAADAVLTAQGYDLCD